jgi:methylated-DNA-[protein]-cysteine S-methyltransferase
MMSSHTTELFSAIVPAPFGAIGIRIEGDVLKELSYLPPQYKAKPAGDKLTKKVAMQVAAYLNNPDYVFDLDLPEVGTEHQRKVWSIINAIPRGKVLTYGEVAHKIRSAPRAVGQACGANWFPLIIPCHRVTAMVGIGGFARHDGGFHQSVKRWLLQHEQVPGF